MKNTIVPALLFSTLAAAVPFHDHAQAHQKRAYRYNTKTVTELTTAMEVVTLSGPLPPGETAYSPEEAAQLMKEGAKGPGGNKPVDWNTVPMFSTGVPPGVTPSADAVDAAYPGTGKPPVPKPSAAPPAPPPAQPSVPSAAPPSYTPAPAPSKTKTTTTSAAAQPTSVIAPPPPAGTSNPPATSVTPPPPGNTAPGGSGVANPYFPNGPKVGEKASNVRLSPFLTYWTGATTEGHIGACGKKPYLDTDPALSKSDSAGDKKFMFHPPVITGDKYADIMQYCGAILDVTGPDGLKTTGTVVDLCEDCGGPGGIDMMKASWTDMFKNVADGDCVYGASWVLTGWAKLLPALY